MDELAPYWNGFFKEKVLFNYVRCNSCKLIFAPVFFSQEQLANLYAQMPANMSDVPTSALQQTQQGYVSILKASTENRVGDYIEIGPDVGLFLTEYIQRNSHEYYWLIEPNQEVTARLADVLSGKDFEIINDMFGLKNIPDNSTSTTVMVQVIDHLLDPLDTLRIIEKKLIRGGFIAIVNHNESSFLRKIFGWKWPAFCLQHPQLFNRVTIKELLTMAGFEIIKQDKTVNYFKVSFLLKHLLWAIGIKVKKVPDFYGITVGLRLGNILTIARRAND